MTSKFVGVVLSVVYWDWLQGGSGNGSNAADVRNIALVVGGIVAILLALWRSLVAERQARAAQEQVRAAQEQSETAKRVYVNERYRQRAVSGQYQKHFGKTAFSVLQAASQWARDQAQTSPIQRHSYERRCGGMLESLTTSQHWPDREESAKEQIERILDWSCIEVPSQ